MNKPKSFKQFLMAVFNITWYEWDENYSGKQKEEIEDEYEYYTEHQDEYSEYFEADYTEEIHIEEGKYSIGAIADAISNQGRFEIVSESVGKYTVDIDGRTCTTTVDLDTLSYGTGITSAEDVKQYEDVLNSEFLCACDEIAKQANA